MQRHLRFRVFGVWGLAFGVWHLGLAFGVWRLGVWGLGFGGTCAGGSAGGLGFKV